MNKIICLNLRSENVLVSRCDEGIRITFNANNTPPIECKYSELAVFWDASEDGKTYERLICDIERNLERLRLPTRTFIRNGGLDLRYLPEGRSVNGCSNDVDYRECQSEMHYLSYLKKNIHRISAESGERIFIINYSVFEGNWASDKPKAIICKWLKELAKKLNVIILVFFLGSPDKTIRETSKCRSLKSIEEVFDTTDYLVSLSFADDPAPEESGFL